MLWRTLVGLPHQTKDACHMSALRLPFLASIALSLAVSACSPQSRGDGYCLSDAECSVGICDTETRRCRVPTDRGIITDAALDRRLDMMVVDMATVDQNLVDASLPDLSLPDQEIPDQELVVIDMMPSTDLGTETDLMTTTTDGSTDMGSASASDGGTPDSAATAIAVVDAIVEQLETESMDDE